MLFQVGIIILFENSWFNYKLQIVIRMLNDDVLILSPSFPLLLVLQQVTFVVSQEVAKR